MKYRNKWRQQRKRDKWINYVCVSYRNARHAGFAVGARRSRHAQFDLLGQLGDDGALVTATRSTLGNIKIKIKKLYIFINEGIL